MDYSPLCQRPRFIHNQKTNPATMVAASNGAGPFAARNSSIFGQFSIRNPDGMYILRETATANITAISRSESLADRSVLVLDAEPAPTEARPRRSATTNASTMDR